MLEDTYRHSGPSWYNGVSWTVVPRYTKRSPRDRGSVLAEIACLNGGIQNSGAAMGGHAHWDRANVERAATVTTLGR